MTRNFMPVNPINTRVKNAVAQLRPSNYDYKGDTDTFQSERFEIHRNTHNTATIAGSTFANAHIDAEQSTLDASETRYLTDEDGVRIGMTMATADGYGHGVDEIDSAKIAGAAAFACEKFNEAVTELFPTDEKKLCEYVTDIGGHAKKAVIPNAKFGDLQLSRNYESSLAMTAVRFDEKGQLDCVLGNVGDGMVVILDGQTRQVKQVLHPKKYAYEYKTRNLKKEKQADKNSKTDTERKEKEFSPFTPMAIQRVTPNTMDFAKTTLAEGDLVIHMTDGIWEELVTSSEIADMEGQREKSSVLKQENFSPVFAKLDSFNAHAVATQVVQIASESTLRKRNEFKEFMLSIEQHIEVHTQKRKSFKSAIDEKNYTFQQWKKDCEDKKLDFTTIQKELDRDIASKHSTRELGTSVSNFVDNLKRKTFGDCATVSVMQMPSLKVELARALIECPHNADRLIPRMIRTIPDEKKSTEWKESIVSALKQEQYVPRKGERGTRKSDLKTQPVYNEQQIKLIDNILDHIIDEKQHGFKEEKRNVFIEPVATLDFLAAIKKYGTKQEKQNALIKIINNPDLSITARNNLYMFSKNYADLNEHRNPYRDRFFGLHNTNGWREMVKKIRQDALGQLLGDELKKCGDDYNAKKTLLQQAREMPIFKDHRNNSIFTGAFGRTQAVIDIDNELASLEREHPTNLMAMAPRL